MEPEEVDQEEVINKENVSFVDEHEAFAASRSSQFVYIPTRDYFFSTLDQHADTMEGDVKPPLVVLGGEGSGKSAFLANWVAKRRIVKHRDEFLFQHFVGCSTKNFELAHTLFRLETELKDFFQLREMEVPDTEERLRWSLSRFLGAAAKKHSHARIVIVIDGVNCLKGEGGREGELYWLPTELPPCVRFIVSSVEHEREQKDDVESSHHRTFVELARRQCPVLRMEPLSVSTRQTIVSTFCNLHSDEFDVHESQQFKMVTHNASSQPLYLRSLLQALFLGVRMTGESIEDLLDDLLGCESSFELIDHCYNMCSKPFASKEDNEEFSDLVAKMMTVIYVSRSGLSMDELWGVIDMINYGKENRFKEKLYTMLQDFTMVVSGLYSFSHAIYNEVVYEKYINSEESLVRWHVSLAKFFNQLPPCDRKLVCLPYHLEVAKSWKKVKNCLTEIDMFDLWWTPKFKHDFMKLWSFLTTSEHGPETTCPIFDPVSEYVKSLDEYRKKNNPSDEEVAEKILAIGDFLIEFATLGHEVAADVPALAHPPLPSPDLCALGVPHIVNDDDKGSVLLMPKLGASQDDALNKGVDAPVKTNDDLPMCTTYFFNRWMWIQYPLIALGNCGSRFSEGIKARQAANPWETSGAGSLDGKEDTKKKSKTGTFFIKGPKKIEVNKASYKLPEIKFIRKVPKTHRKVPNPDDELEQNAAAAGDALSKRIDAMNDEIFTIREEFDFTKQQRSILAKKVIELRAMLKELQLSEASTGYYSGHLDTAIKNEAAGQETLRKANSMRDNLKKLYTMCERHPAHSPALLVELETKLKQDNYLLSEIKKRLWEQGFEFQSHQSNFRQAKALVQRGVDMHTQLLEYRYEMKRHIQLQADQDARALNSRAKVRSSTHDTSVVDTPFDRIDNNLSTENSDDVARSRWESTWQIITSRTGITEPDIFFERLNNGGVLEAQIKQLRKNSDAKLSALKNEVGMVEGELEEVRYEASFVGGQSRDTYQKHKELATVQQKLRRIKERTERTEQGQQQVVAGLHHIAEMLGLPERDRNASIVDVMRDIETVLETLVEELEKQQQGQQTASVHSDSSHRGMMARDGLTSPETHTRPPELEAVLTKFDIPKARLAMSLPSRPNESSLVSDRDVDEDDDDDVPDRQWTKTQSNMKIRTQKKLEIQKVRGKKMENTS